MKINFNLARLLLWVVTVVVVFFVWLFIVFFICGLVMSVFQVEDSLALMVYAFFCMPFSVICAGCFIARKRDVFTAFIDANVGR